MVTVGKTDHYSVGKVLIVCICVCVCVCVCVLVLWVEFTNSRA